MAKQKKTKEKGRIRTLLEWRGLLDEESNAIRYTMMGILAIISAALTFLQLGFLGLGSDGSYVCYVSTLLFPIVLTSLLMGRWWGVLMGAYTGAVLLFHAHYQPLDIFEQYFINVLNSIGIYSLVGLVASLTFAIAFKNNVRGIRAVVYVLISCAVLSAVHSLVFIANLIIAVSVRVIELNEGNTSIEVPTETLRSLVGVGDPFLQLLANFVVMSVLCLLMCYLVERYRKMRGSPKLRPVFNLRLFIVVLLAFLVTSAASFVTTTERAKDEAHAHMVGEIEYIVNRIEFLDDRTENLDELKSRYKIANNDLSSLYQSVSLDHLLDGYSLEEDGTLVIVQDGTIVQSNNPAFAVGDSLNTLYGSNARKMLDGMANDDAMPTVLYDTKKYDPDDESPTTTQIGYACTREVGGRYVIMMLPSSVVFASRTETISWLSLTAFVLLMVVFFVASKILTTVVVRQIDETNESLAKITQGDLDESVEVAGTVEFASLSEGINDTVDALKGWIGEAERRMENELDTAKAIQESALPSTFPPFPEVDAFDLYATMNAARHVGGDFYDFFLIDDHTLGFLIADVSGKGVPASLFMMAAKTEICNYLSTGMKPSRAILSANQHLCKGNDAGMFVTVWAATLDWETGLLTYVNAGHNPPLLRHGKGGDWEWLTQKGGLFLGTFETAKYRQGQLTMEPGDELLLYTDGVNEAFSVGEEEYGNDRLEAFVQAHSDLHPRQLVEALRGDVAEWAAGAEQSDDITMLCLEYGVAPEVGKSVEVPATLDQFEGVLQIIVDELDDRLCPVDITHKIAVALEELFVNVCNYAYADQDEPGNVIVSYCYYTDPSTIEIELTDHGVPFNPVTREDPTRPSSIQEAKIGGLGIFMVKKTMDDLSYRRVNDMNVVTFTKSW